MNDLSANPPVSNTGESYRLAPSDGERSRTLDLNQLRLMLWRQRKLIGFLTIAAVLIGLAITLFMNPRYSSEATVVIENQGLQVVEGGDVNPVVSSAETMRYFATQQRIIQSGSLALAVVDELNLTGSERFMDEVGVPELPGSIEETVAANAKKLAAANYLRENVQMEMDGASRVATISFTAGDPILAAQITNGYVTSYIIENVRGGTDANQFAREALEQQVAEKEAELAEVERRALVYARNNDLIDTSDGENQTSVTGASLSQANQSLGEAQRDRIVAQERYQAARSGDPLSMPEARNNATIQSLFAARAEALATLTQLRERYVDSAPEVRQAQARVDTLDRQLNDAASQLRESLRKEFVAAREVENQIASRRADLSGQALSEQSRRLEFNMLTREAENLREQLSQLRLRLSQVNTAGDTATNNVALLDSASVPVLPSSPNLPLNLLASLIVGLGVAGGLAFVREAFDRTIYTPADMEQLTGVPVLGTTPTSDMDDPDVLTDLHSELNEAYFSIRTALDYTTGGKQKKVIQITSTRSAEGKSTTSYSLARDFARVGRRTLLVDTDFRKPQLHKMHGLDNRQGLVDLVNGRATLPELRQSTDIDGLDFLSLGAIPDNPSQLISSGQLSAAVNEFKNTYDVVILDSAPVLGLADAPGIGAIADFSVFVIQSGRSNARQVDGALRRMRETGSKLVGAVLTQFDAKRTGQGEDYYYYYAYNRDGDS